MTWLQQNPNTNWSKTQIQARNLLSWLQNVSYDSCKVGMDRLLLHIQRVHCTNTWGLFQPSFQSVPCPLYMSCTMPLPPIKQSFLRLCHSYHIRPGLQVHQVQSGSPIPALIAAIIQMYTSARNLDLMMSLTCEEEGQVKHALPRFQPQICYPLSPACL